MSINFEKTEYNYLLGLYLNLLHFEPTTSTFLYLEELEKKELDLTISVLKRKLAEIMPKVQDREASNATDKAYDRTRKE